MKKRILSILLCLAMILPLLPTFELPAAAADDSKNVSNTSTDTFETLDFNTDTSELTSAVSSTESPTGPGNFAIRTISELLLSGKGWSSEDIEEWNDSLKSNLGYGLYDYENSAVNFNSKYDGYMYNLRKNTSSTAYTSNSLPTDYNFVKTLAFDPTGSGQNDFVAYLYAKYTWATLSYSTFTLYVANKDGVVSSVYDLGKAPFILRTHQADAYLPLAAGDYDGDGKDELAVYCFGDSTKASQWGSTTAPYYKTDVSGNAVDNQYRRINASGYLLDTDGVTWLKADASGKLINSAGYLVVWDSGKSAYVYIDADGNTTETPVSGTPVNDDPVLGEPVGYKTVPVDDENLDVRVLDVGVTTDAQTEAVTGIALTRATRGAAGGGSINIEYDLTNLGFSKADVGSGELANMKLYPIVDLSTVEQPGDEYDDLVLCVSRANYSVKTAAEAATRTVFWIDPGSSTGAKTQTMSGVWYHRADYGNNASAAYSAEMMAFGGASEANLDGDADGVNEVVVAGYRYANTNTTVSLSSLTATPSGDDNPFKMDDADSDNINYYLAATYSYDAANKSYASDGPATWIFVDDGEYNDSTNLREEIYDGNTVRDVVFSPLEVLGFAEKGAGYADSVFINSFVCDYYLGDGTVGTLPYGPWDDLKNSAFSKRGGKFLFVSYAIPTSYILVENDPSRDGKATTHQRWIGDAIAGNFDGDASGVEELYCTYMRNRNANGYDLTSATLLAVQKMKPGVLSNTLDLYNSSLKINDDGSIYDEHDTVKSKNYSFSGNDLWQAEEGRSFALSAPDWDDDSVIARPSNKAPEYYFSDPNVIAVLQSAPYFEELSADYDFYPSNGSTSIEKETGTTNSGSAGFEVSAGLIIGMKAEIKPFGIPIGETEVKNTVTASLSTEYSHETTQSYSTAFTAMVGTDMVALTMTPYVRYYYDVYDPDKDGWVTAEMTIDMPKTPRTTMTSVETYDRVAQYSGWESIRGNILSNTPGDPYSYATTSSGLSSFEGGKTTMGSSGNNWVGVGTGGTSSVGNITQTISSEKTDGFSVSVGLNFEYEATATAFGATAGFTASAGVTAGYGYATFTGMSFSGTVDNLPQDAAAGYDFLWRFGCWKDSLSYTTSSGKTDSNSVYVLGYLVKDVESLPKPPQDLSVVDFTENSITLEWSHPDPMPVSYIIYREESGGLVPLEIVRADASNGKTTQQYTDTTCEPGTEYSYVIASVRYVNGFETKGPNSPTATGKTLSSDAPKVSISPLRPVVQSGDNVTLTATVTGIPGGSAPTVQWQKWNGSSYVNLDGESGLTYKMTNVTDELSGSRYRCYVTQTVHGKWKVGYSVYSELTVTKRASKTELGAANASYASGSTVNLSASVADKDTNAAITDGSVVFSIVNTSTGGVWNLKGSLDGSGNVTNNTFKPTVEGIYTVSARYLGTKVYAGSESAEKSFTVYSETGKVLMIDSNSEMTYGDKLLLKAKLVDSEGKETDASTATYKVTDGTTFDSQATSVSTGATFDPITSSDALFFLRNGQKRGYNDACGNYIIQATYTDTDSSTTYYATKLVTVKPKTLEITVGDKTIQGFSSTTLNGTYLDDVAVTYNGFASADNDATQTNYKALFEVYTDTAYKDLYVGNHPIKLRYKDATASGLTNYDVTLAQLLKNYNVLCKNGTLSIADDWCTVTYSVADGEGSLDARTASRASLASSEKVLSGTPLTFAAAPAVGYEVEGWNVTGSKLSDSAGLQSVGDTASTKSGAITADTEVVVTFAASYPKLSWSVVDGNGALTPSISASSPAYVNATDTYTFTAVPDSGYMVNEWKVNGNVKTNADGTTYQGTTLTVSNLEGDTDITVKYTKSVSYTVSASGMDTTGAALGSVTVSPGAGSVQEGTALTFTANAPIGYIIKEWRKYTDETNYTVLQYNVPTYSIASLTADTDIRVVFMQAVKYKLSFGANDKTMGGIEAASDGKQLTSGSTYYAGIPVTFTVKPVSGYRIKSVTTNDPANPTLTPVTTASGENTHSITLSKTITVTATFEAASNPHSVTVTNGTVGGGTSGSFYENDTVVVTANAAPAGKIFSGWTSADGVTFANASAATTTFVMPNKAVTVTANYYTPSSPGPAVTTQYTLSFETNGGSAVEPVTEDKDSKIDLTAYKSTKSGYTFGGWYSDSALTTPVTSATLTGNMTVYAKWTAAGVKYLNTDDHIAYLVGYDTGDFGPGQNMTRAEAAMMFFRLLSDQSADGSNSFPDVDTGAWYGAAVEKLAGLGIITGYDDGTFRPGNPITRAEFVTMASRFADLSDAECSFTDVSADYWAYKYIAFTSVQGWISGYPDGSFGPDNNITRAEVTKIVNKMLGRTADTSYIDGHSVKVFPDVSSDYWAYYEICEAANAHDYTKSAEGAESWTNTK